MKSTTYHLRSSPDSYLRGGCRSGGQSFVPSSIHYSTLSIKSFSTWTWQWFSENTENILEKIDKLHRHCNIGKKPYGTAAFSFSAQNIAKGISRSTLIVEPSPSLTSFWIISFQISQKNGTIKATLGIRNKNQRDMSSLAGIQKSRASLAVIQSRRA